MIVIENILNIGPHTLTAGETIDGKIYVNKIDVIRMTCQSETEFDCKLAKYQKGNKIEIKECTLIPGSKTFPGILIGEWIEFVSWMYLAERSDKARDLLKIMLMDGLKKNPLCFLWQLVLSPFQFIYLWTKRFLELLRDY